MPHRVGLRGRRAEKQQVQASPDMVALWDHAAPGVLAHYHNWPCPALEPQTPTRVHRQTAKFTALAAVYERMQLVKLLHIHLGHGTSSARVNSLLGDILPAQSQLGYRGE